MLTEKSNLLFSVIATLAEINSSERLVNKSLIFQLGSKKLVPNKVEKYQMRKMGLWDKVLREINFTLDLY